MFTVNEHYVHNFTQYLLELEIINNIESEGIINCFHVTSEHIHVHNNISVIISLIRRMRTYSVFRC